MLKHITPSLAGAHIPDPSRGRDLPATGAVVEFSPYWIILASRGEVLVRDVLPSDGVDTSPSPPTPPPPQLTDVLTLRRQDGGGFEITLADLVATLAPLLGGGTTPPSTEAGFTDLSQPLTANSLLAL